jgi:hypothetical protein
VSSVRSQYLPGERLPIPPAIGRLSARGPELFSGIITSERRLIEEVRMHLAYRWFTRLGFEQEIPDHSTFTKKPALLVLWIYFQVAKFREIHEVFCFC